MYLKDKKKTITFRCSDVVFDFISKKSNKSEFINNLIEHCAFVARGEEVLIDNPVCSDKKNANLKRNPR